MENNLYNKKYLVKNYFHYRKWLFNPFIKSLVSISGLKKGSTLLDVGCGQGFFSNLFYKCGMNVIGIDTSEAGIRAAQHDFFFSNIEFQIIDILDLPLSMNFDCIFIRSCSLYNSDNFSIDSQITDELIRHVKKDGTFLFVYNTNFSSSKKTKTWKYHTLDDFKNHFSKYYNAKFFFINKFDTIIFRKYAFNFIFSKLNIFLSKYFSIGGEIIVILKK